MKRLAKSIVRHRLFLMVFMLVLCVPAVFGIMRTRVNFDLTSYLAKDTVTSRGLALMNREFENTSSLSIALIDADEDQIENVVEGLSGMDGVMQASHDPKDVAVRDGETYSLVQVIMREDQAENVYSKAQTYLSDMRCLIDGPVRDSHIIQSSLEHEIPLVMAVSVVIVLIVLVLMSRSAFAPVLFILDILVSILLNMGTNWIFSSISFITFAVAAILQLALAMDYSIMLMNAYDRFLDAGLSPADAMTEALAASFMPIVSSAMTTVAGMLSLLFMQFTIGFDIGIVLAKGIIISMVTVFLFMPGLLILATPLMRKTRHKPLHISGRLVSRAAAKGKGVIPVLLLVLILVSAFVQGGNRYTYTVRDIDADAAVISSLFGRSQQIVLLFPKCGDDESYERQSAMLREMQALNADGHPVVKDVYAMPTTGEMAIRSWDAGDLAGFLGMEEGSVRTMLALASIRLPMRGDALVHSLKEAAGRFAALVPSQYLEQLDQIADLLALAERTFNGEHYSRAILNTDLSYMDAGTKEALSSIRQIMTSFYGGDWAMAGGLTATDDIAASFGADVNRVSWITIGAVFLIILLSFRNAVVPTLLVCAIQGAIWVNMAYSGLVDKSIFFMCYLICMALQMGATVDYGILLAGHYRNLRRQTMNKKEAVEKALDLSMQTILTSGLALVTAGFAVGRISSVFYISSIGTMLGRGAIVSVVMILFLIPQLLLWFDPWIIRTNGKDEK